MVLQQIEDKNIIVVEILPAFFSEKRHNSYKSAVIAYIEVNGIALEIKSEIFRLIPTDNPCWDSVYFFTYDPDEKKMVPDCNYFISYSEEGIHLPLIIKSYTTFTGYALFYHFPANITGKTKAIIRIRTAIGEVKKKILLLEYNETFPNQEWEDVQQYFRSLGDRT